MAAEPAPGLTSEDVLRTAFIEMLFALAAGQVAIELFDVVSVSNSLIPKYYCYSHLALSLLLIAASWVGWRQSVSPGMKSKVTRIFSLAFVGLLIDVSLVLLYFIVVKAAEIGAQNGDPVLKDPSGVPEAFWFSIIFFVYMVWDVLADVFEDGCIPPPAADTSRNALQYAWLVFRLCIVSTFASLVCFLLCLLTHFLAQSATGYSVICIDLMLFAVVIMFRAFKGFENFLAPLAAVIHCKAFEEKRPVGNSDIVWGTMMAMIYVYAAMMAFLGA